MTKLADSIFGTESFKALSYKDKTQFIRDHSSVLPKLSPNALEYLATCMIRSDCYCDLIIQSDDPEEREYIGHTVTCPRMLAPVDEDFDDSTIRRRKERIFPVSPKRVLVLQAQASER